MANTSGSGGINASLGLETSGFTKGITDSINSLQKFVSEVTKANQAGKGSFKPISDALNNFAQTAQKVGTEANGWFSPLKDGFKKVGDTIANLKIELDTLAKATNDGAAKTKLQSTENQKLLNEQKASVTSLIAEYVKLAQELGKVLQLVAKLEAKPKEISLRSTPLQKDIQGQMYVGTAFGTDPTGGVLKTLRNEITSLMRDLGNLGATPGVIKKTEEFTALRNSVQATKDKIKDLQDIINKPALLGTASTKADVDNAIAASKELYTGLAKNGVITKAINADVKESTRLAGQLDKEAYADQTKKVKELVAASKVYGVTQADHLAASRKLSEAIKIEQAQLEATTGTTKKAAVQRADLNTSIDKNKEALKAHTVAMDEATKAGGRHSMNLKSLISWQVEWYLSQGLIFGMVNAFKTSIGTMVEFEQRLANLKAVTNSTTLETEALGMAARDLGLRSRMGAVEIADGMTILGQAGFSAKETITAMNAVVALSTSTLTPMSTAVDLVTTALRGFELDASKSGEVANVLAAGVNYSKLNMEDLKTSFNYVATAGHQVGMSLAQVTAALGVMRDRGIQASTAGTGFRGIVGALLAPTERFKKEIEKVGLTMELVNPSFNSFGEILKRLKEHQFSVTNAFEGMDKRQAGALITLIQSANAYELLTDKITGTNAAFSMQKTQLQTVQSAWMMFSNNITELGLKIGDMLLPALSAVLVPITSGITTLNTFGNAVDPMISGFVKWATASVVLAGGIILVTKAVIPFAIEVLGLAKAFEAVGVAMTWTNIRALMTGWGAIIVLLGSVATAIWLVTSHYEQLRVKQLELNQTSANNVESLRAVVKELQGMENGSEALKTKMTQLSTVYPELKKHVDLYSVSVKDATEAVLKLTEAQTKNLFLTASTQLSKTKKFFDEPPGTRVGLLRSNTAVTPDYATVLRTINALEEKLSEGKLEGFAKTNSESILKINMEIRDTIQETGRLRDVYKQISEDSNMSAIVRQKAAGFLKQYNDELKRVHATEILEKENIKEKSVDQEKFNIALRAKTKILTDAAKNQGISPLALELKGIETTRTEFIKLGRDEVTVNEWAEAAIAAAKFKYRKEAIKGALADLAVQKWIDAELAKSNREVINAKIATLKAEGKDAEAEREIQKLKLIDQVKATQEELLKIDTKIKEIRLRNAKSDTPVNQEELREAYRLKAVIVANGETLLNEIRLKFSTELSEKDRKYAETLLKDDASEAKRLLAAKKAAVEAEGTRGTRKKSKKDSLIEAEGLDKEAIIDYYNEKRRLKEIDFEQSTQSTQSTANQEKYVQWINNSIDAEQKELALLERRYIALQKNTTFGKELWDGFLNGIEKAIEATGTLGDNIEKAVGSLTNKLASGLTDIVVDITTGFPKAKEEADKNRVKLAEMQNELAAKEAELATLSQTGSAYAAKLKEINDLKAAMATLNDQTAKLENNFENAKKAFIDFTRSFLEEIQKQIVKLLIAYAIEQALGWAMSLGGGGFGSAEYSAGQTSGNTNPIFVPARATGGILPGIQSFRKFSSGGITGSPMLAMLGDNASGKELVIPSESIKENSVSGYTRDKKDKKGENVIINLFDKQLVPQLIAEFPNSTLNVLNGDILKRGMSYQVIKAMR